ncbi:hypothetical protein TWF718_005479 [Orbilia javanica]|uniref:S-adenosyl-L-methionine-dependent methyltransferase n=1 Tax=Orbilia javanica TaxID=47235 RepID=A0AAN8N7R7_9PEZI
MAECNSMTMSSGNTYNDNCHQQTAVLKASLHLFDDIELGPNVTIADYGCSQGSNSVMMMQHVLKRMPPSSTASLIFEDLPSNEFSSLIKLLPELCSSNPSLKIYPSLVPRSFYESVLTPNTVDIGFTSCTIHWLKRMPEIKPPTETVEEYYSKRYARNAPSAKEDFHEFLTYRGQEIKSGGYLIIGCLGGFTKEELAGSYKDATVIRHKAVFKAVEKLVEQGVLPQEAVANINVPIHDRLVEDFLSGIEELKDTWVMEKYERKLVSHPAYYKYLSIVKDADREGKIAAAKEYAGTNIDWILAIMGDMLKSWWLQAGVKEDKIDEYYEMAKATAKDILWKEGPGGAEMPMMYTRLRRV